MQYSSGAHNSMVVKEYDKNNYIESHMIKIK